MTDNFENITTEDLQQRRANAYHTYCMCSGHTKSAMNDALVMKYDAEIERRGLLVNNAIEGVFNGKGST